jgi:hypothetical protein
MPWAIIGDLNEILYSHEKDGGNPRPTGYMEAFRDVLADCNLEDLEFTGDPFTWKREPMRERLDRVLVNHSWSVLFPGAALQHLDYCRSDHRVILLDTDFQNINSQVGRGPKKFETNWLLEKNFRKIVQQAWEQAKGDEPDGCVLKKLGRVHEALHDWDKNILKQPKRRHRKAQREFENAVYGAITDGPRPKQMKEQNPYPVFCVFDDNT